MKNQKHNGTGWISPENCLKMDNSFCVNAWKPQKPIRRRETPLWFELDVSSPVSLDELGWLEIVVRKGWDGRRSDGMYVKIMRRDSDYELWSHQLGKQETYTVPIDIKVSQQTDFVYYGKELETFNFKSLPKNKGILSVYEGTNFCIFNTKEGASAFHSKWKDNDIFCNDKQIFESIKMKIKKIFTSRHADYGYLQTSHNIYVFTNEYDEDDGYDLLGLQEDLVDAGQDLFQNPKPIYFKQDKKQIKQIIPNEYAGSFLLMNNGDIYISYHDADEIWVKVLICDSNTGNLLSGKPVQIGCDGNDNFYALLDNNSVIKCDRDTVSEEQKWPIGDIYTFPDKISVKKIACGDAHFLALTGTNQVYAYGKNDCHQCGNFDSMEIIEKPRLIESLKDVSHVLCGAKHSGAIDQNKEYYLWGKNDGNQCVVDKHKDQIFIPTPIQKIIFKETQLYVTYMELGKHGTHLILGTFREIQKGTYGAITNVSDQKEQKPNEYESVSIRINMNDAQKGVFEYFRRKGLHYINNANVVSFHNHSFKPKFIKFIGDRQTNICAFDGNEWTNVSLIKKDDDETIQTGNTAMYKVSSMTRYSIYSNHNRKYMGYASENGFCREIYNNPRDSQFGFIEIDKEKKLYYIISKYEDDRKEHWLGFSKSDKYDGKMVGVSGDIQNRAVWHLIPEKEQMCFKIKCYKNQQFEGWISYQKD
eukprot:401831_1